ncbi:hypothetical protein PROFUN_05454, partial [Planoprotostelium fungivorum]
MRCGVARDQIWNFTAASRCYLQYGRDVYTVPGSASTGCSPKQLAGGGLLVLNSVEFIGSASLASVKIKFNGRCTCQHTPKKDSISQSLKSGQQRFKTDSAHASLSGPAECHQLLASTLPLLRGVILRQSFFETKHSVSMMVRFAIAVGTYLISFVFWLLEWYYMLIFATSILLSQEDIRKAHQSTPREKPSYWRPHEEQRTRLGLRAEPCLGVQSFCQEFRTRIQWAKNAVSSEEKIFEKILAFIDQLGNETAEHGIPEVGGLSSFLRLLMDNIKNVEDVTMKAQALDNLRALSTLFPYMLGLVRFKQETKTQLISKLSDLRVTHHEHGELQGHQVIQSANDSRLYPFWYNAQTNSRKLLILLNTTFASFGSTYKTPHLIRKSVKSLYTFAHCLLYSHRSSQMSRAICDDKLFDVNMIQYIWCLPDNIIPMKWMQRYTLPSVAISQQFDIPSRANGPLKGANVKARLISSKAIPGFVYPFQNLQREVSGREMPLIMHMHGGGFISGSTNMHENYLREWAIITGYPIVSIDYSLAPQQKYPTQLNECFEAYRV